MGWTKAIAVADLAPGTRQVVKVGNRNILLLNQSGQFYAVDNRCPHLNLPMKKGKVQDDCSIVCPWHRSVFDLKSGDVKAWTPFPPVVGKALGMISDQKSLPVYPTRVEEDSLWVEVN